MARVVHLTSAHPRYDTRVFIKECRSLARAGHEVSLLVADGNGDEMRDEVRIYDVGRPRGRIGRMVGTTTSIYRKAREMNGDLYHVHEPELLRVALKLKKRNGGSTRTVFDSHEDLPRQILGKSWIPAPTRRTVAWLAERYENYAGKRMSGIVGATPVIAKRFVKLNTHTVNVNNYPIPEELAPSTTSRRNNFQICYVGTISRVRGIECLIRALPLVPSVTLVLCGQFYEEGLESEMRALPGWAQVDYRGQVDRIMLSKVLGESIAGIVAFLSAPNHVDAQPNKMFEYMSAGLPVIASNFPLWRQLVETSGAGLCVDPQSPEAIAKAIRRLMHNPEEVERRGKAGRDAVFEKYNWPNEEAKLVDFYKELGCGL